MALIYGGEVPNSQAGFVAGIQAPVLDRRLPAPPLRNPPSIQAAYFEVEAHTSGRPPNPHHPRTGSTFTPYAFGSRITFSTACLW